MRDCGIGCSPFVYLAISLHKKGIKKLLRSLQRSFCSIIAVIRV